MSNPLDGPRHEIAGGADEFPIRFVMDTLAIKLIWAFYNLNAMSLCRVAVNSHSLFARVYINCMVGNPRAFCRFLLYLFHFVDVHFLQASSLEKQTQVSPSKLFTPTVQDWRHCIRFPWKHEVKKNKIKISFI